MELGMVGLGKMGANMARRLLAGGHRVIVYDREPAAASALSSEGAVGTATLGALVSSLRSPRAIWLMVPAGEPTERVIDELAAACAPDDVIVDGGNAFYKDSIRRATRLRERRIHFLDVGTSGGIWGRERGYCLMIGGEEAAFRRLEPIFKTLASPDGYLYVGSSGSGHFVKMVHNGIEYGMLQAYAEGIALLRRSDFSIDLARVAKLWNHGSVVRSWLLELVQRVLEQEPDLASIEGHVEDSGEGRWMVHEAVDLGVPIPVIASALLSRFRSQAGDSFSDKVVAALRREFGGHPVKRS